MEQYADVVIDLEGNAIQGATVQIFSGAPNAWLQKDFTTPAKLYDSNGTQQDAVVTDGRGAFAFQAPNGKYVLQVKVRGTIYATIGPRLFYDPADDFDRVTATQVQNIADQSTSGLRGELAADDGASRIGFKQAGAGAVLLSLQSNERISVNVKQFGAVGDSVADDSNAIVFALTALQNLGGGVLNFPFGRYRVTKQIVIPSFVRIQGLSWLPDAANGTQANASTFYVDWGGGSNTSDAFILSYSSAIDGMGFYYPGQVKKNAAQPIPYGFSISTPNGGGIYDNAQITNVTLYNSYRGIRLNRSGRWRVRDIQGDPLYIGISSDQCYDVCYLENVHFWNFYTQGDTLEAWCANNRTYYDLQRVDQLFASKLFGWNSQTCFNCGKDLWANFTDILCDKARYPLVMDQAAQLEFNGVTLISSPESGPAIWSKSVNSANFNAVKISDTCSVGAQIDGGGDINFNNTVFNSPNASVVCTSTSTKVQIGDSCSYKIPPFGAHNVRVSGEKLPNDSTVIALPTPIQTPGVIANGYQFDLSTTATQVLQYETTYISQRNSLFVLEFDYELVGFSATWYFQFLIQSDTGANTQVAFAPPAPLVLNGTAGAPKRVRIPFFINHGRFKQVMSLRVMPTVGQTGAALKVTNIELREQANRYTTDAQVSNMMRAGYNLDAYGMGQTLFSKGKNRLVLTQSEVGIGRPTEVPSFGSWEQGDEIMVFNPAGGGPRLYLCVASGEQGTWEPRN